MRDFWQRRDVLRTVVGGVGGLSAIEATTGAARAESTNSVTFNDQTSNGQEVVIDRVRCDVDVRYGLRAINHDERHAFGRLSAGTDVQEFTVTLDTPLTEDRRLAFSIYPDEGGQSLDRDTATVTVSDDVTYLDKIPAMRVDADPDAGFNYPYFLYAPPVPEAEAGGPLLVEPNNTGTSTDDFQQHEERARELITSGISRDISGNLGVPMIVPVFPRPRSDPVDGTHYTHQLDRDTLQISSGPLERIDQQLLRMVDHAQQKLRAEGYPVESDIILNGFSASGNFVDRFTVLHPDRVLSVTGGGLNGMALLPLSELDGQTLNYHVGVADVEELVGEPVDTDALAEVNQLLYMGAEDTNDTIPYTDAWTSDELRRTALDVYGDDMITERFPTCQAAYEQAGVDAQFKVYDGVGHTPQPAKADIIEFHRRSIEGEDVSGFGDQLGVTATIEQSPAEPRVGESVEFDATGSRIDRGEIIANVWEFSDGETAAGGVVTHVFDEPGKYSVHLKIADTNGRTAESNIDLTVRAKSDQSEDTETATTSTVEGRQTDREGTETTTTTATSTSPVEGRQTEGEETVATEVESPGFGVATALTSLGGTIFALHRWGRDNAEN